MWRNQRERWLQLFKSNGFSLALRFRQIWLWEAHWTASACVPHVQKNFPPNSRQRPKPQDCWWSRPFKRVMMSLAAARNTTYVTDRMHIMLALLIVPRLRTILRLDPHRRPFGSGWLGCHSKFPSNNWLGLPLLILEGCQEGTPGGGGGGLPLHKHM